MLVEAQAGGTAWWPSTFNHTVTALYCSIVVKSNYELCAVCVVATGWLVHRGGARASSSIKWDFIQGGPRLSDFCFVFFYLPDLQNKPI